VIDAAGPGNITCPGQKQLSQELPLAAALHGFPWLGFGIPMLDQWLLLFGESLLNNRVGANKDMTMLMWQARNLAI